MRAALLAVLLLALLAPPAAAQDIFQEGQTITIELMNGDKLTGLLEQADAAKLVILHDILGRLEIARAAIKPAVPAPPPTPPASPWSGKFDLSLSGSQGNTENQNFRTQLDVRHEDDEAIDLFTFWFRRAEAETEVTDPVTGVTDDEVQTTEEKSFTQWRHEWKGGDERWRPFVQASYETDTFLDYNARGAVAAGAAYQFEKSEEHDLVGRIGGGLSKKFGISRDFTNPDGVPPPDGPKQPLIDDALAWEALFGLDWAWKLSELSKFTLTADLYPSINPSGEYRSVTRLAYETKVSADSAWFLKLGLDRFHDTDAGDTKKTWDRNYYLGLGRTF